MKRRKLDVPVREQKQLKKERRVKDFADALEAIEKQLRLKSTSHRARVIQSTLHLVVRNSRKLMDASEMATKTHGFARAGGSRLARQWTADWIKKRSLPESDRGRHAKTWSLLNDPEVKDELKAYLRTNKWSMNPEKLVEYSKAKVVTEEMKKFVQDTKYLEADLFPRVGYKVVRGISLPTARRWLHGQGFEITEVKKGLFYDGTSHETNERPDNVAYRQEEFIPAFDAFWPYFVEYQVDNLELVVENQHRPLDNFGWY
ncbi:hypothetical protein R3P38DRAFT_3334313 [Favolaschia claudopus]|uniref:Uncharacterized protein n=1 Tax=Favolaschia claudopus TaxID=2862362 RepID=A0AAV9ZDI3_9AGAR